MILDFRRNLDMEKDEEDKVKRVIKIIDDMDIKDKLRLGIR